jgi:ADP-heptose:LPS heptosyltransferase
MGLILDLAAGAAKLHRRHQPQRSPTVPRILVIRRNRMGDMILTLPLLYALRRHVSHAHLAVACDLPGVPIAQACPAVNEVIVLNPGWNPWQAALKNAAHLQDYDWVIAAKGGFDRRLAVLTRLTNAAIRIGFELQPGHASQYYTDAVALPDEPQEEHQVDTLLRLLKPLGLLNPKGFTAELTLTVPEASREFAAGILSEPPFSDASSFVLINLSSTASLKFREEDFIELAKRILGTTKLAVGLVAAPNDQAMAEEVAICMGSKRIVAVPTTGPLDLAALIQQAVFFVTPEGGAAHLAATVGTPALVLWSEGPFKKWYSRGKRHAFVHAESGEKIIPVERVWTALQPFLSPK